MPNFFMGTGTLKPEAERNKNSMLQTNGIVLNREINSEHVDFNGTRTRELVSKVEQHRVSSTRGDVCP